MNFNSFSFWRLLTQHLTTLSTIHPHLLYILVWITPQDVKQWIIRQKRPGYDWAIRKNYASKKLKFNACMIKSMLKGKLGGGFMEWSEFRLMVDYVLAVQKVFSFILAWRNDKSIPMYLCINVWTNINHWFSHFVLVDFPLEKLHKCCR